MPTILSHMKKTIIGHKLVEHDSPILLMVSGGSDSTALAYLASELRENGEIGPLGIMHVNHRLRGADADADAAFVGQLAELLSIPLFTYEIDVKSIADEQRGNIEAVARNERYQAAIDALEKHCQREGAPIASARIFTAHTADDRIENFYMRSIVGTGPGGFRSMLYSNGKVARPLLDVEREALRTWLREQSENGRPMVHDDEGALWREDATNAHTDRFRAYVRHEIVPLAKERNPQLVTTLTRTMNLIGDEDDMLDEMTADLVEQHVVWLESDEGCVLSPWLAAERVPLQRRVAVKILGQLLGADARVETASVEALLAGFRDGRPNSGYVANIQGNLAISANKEGIRVEPMSVFRTRRKMDA